MSGSQDPNGGASSNFAPIGNMVGAGGPGSAGPVGPSGAPMPAQGDPQAALASVTSVISDIESQLTALGKSFPQAAPELRQAIQSVRAVMMRIVSNPGGAEPAAPRGPLG